MTSSRLYHMVAPSSTSKTSRALNTLRAASAASFTSLHAAPASGLRFTAHHVGGELALPLHFLRDLEREVAQVVAVLGSQHHGIAMLPLSVGLEHASLSVVWLPLQPRRRRHLEIALGVVVHESSRHEVLRLPSALLLRGVLPAMPRASSLSFTPSNASS